MASSLSGNHLHLGSPSPHIRSSSGSRASSSSYQSSRRLASSPLGTGQVEPLSCSSHPVAATLSCNYSMALEPPLGSSSRQAEEAPASNGNASSANTNGAHINGANGHSRNGSSNGNGHVASSSTPRPRACWATLMTGDSYLPGLA